MFKTNSRKGLGLASIVALVGSLIVGATPAQAAGEVNLVTAKGTTYAALAGTSFQFTVNAGSSIPQSSWGTLKTKITHTSGASYSSTVSATTGATFTGDVTTTKSASTIVPVTVSSTLSAYTVTISTADSSSDAVLTVQSWLDADGDGTIDVGEFASDVRTLTFYKTSAITWQTAFSAPVLSPSAQTLSAVVSTAEGINMAQLADDKVQVAFATVSGTAYTTIGTGTSSSPGVFITGENTAVPTGTNTRLGKTTNVTVVASSTYMAVAVVDGVEVGGEQYAVVGAASVAAIEDMEVTEGANTKQSASNEVTIRAGVASSVELVSAVSKSAGVKAAAGTLVTVTVGEVSLTSVSSVVGGGKSLANLSSTTSEKIEFTVAVDADGEVTVPITANLKAGESFTVRLSNGSALSSVTTVSAAATAYTEIKDLSTFGSGSIIKVTSGTSATLTFGILDNFGEALTGDYRVVLKSNKGLTTQSAMVAGSQVSFTVTPTTTTEFYAQVQELNKSTLAYDDKLAAATRSVTVGTSTAPANVTLVATSASNLVLNNNAQKAVDTRMGATAPKVNSAGHRATLSGQVTNVNGIATYGVVTLSAPNVMFVVGGVYSLGSVSVETDTTGAYADIAVYSNTAGKVTVSATVGAATKDLGLTFLPAAETAGAKWVVTAPTNVVPGSTAQFKAQLLDTWSNPVKVTSASRLAVTYTGPGFVTAALPSSTDADGMMMFSVLYGTADSGTATIKFAYDGDATATTATDNVATTVTVTIGAAAPAAPAADQKLTVGSFKGFVAIYALNYTGSKLSAKVAGRWLVEDNLSRFERVVRLTGAGYTIKVDLYIDGKFVRSETVVTK